MQIRCSFDSHVSHLISLEKLSHWSSWHRFDTLSCSKFTLLACLSLELHQNTSCNLRSTSLDWVSYKFYHHLYSIRKQKLELSTRPWSGRAPRNCAKFVYQPSPITTFFMRSLFYFLVGRYSKTLDYSLNVKKWLLFPHERQCSPRLRLCELRIFLELFPLGLVIKSLLLEGKNVVFRANWLVTNSE